MATLDNRDICDKMQNLKSVLPPHHSDESANLALMASHHSDDEDNEVSNKFSLFDSDA